MERIESNPGFRRSKPAIIIIPTDDGDRKINVDKLNYIDIEQRSLCYHLVAGCISARCMLRTSFTRATEAYLQHDNLLFIKPSLIININNVDALDKERIIFTNGEELYFPRRHYLEIYEKWCECG